VVWHDADKPEPGHGPAQPSPVPLRLVNGPRPGRHLGPRRPSASVNLPPAVSSGPDVKSLLRAMRRRWLLASSVGVLTALVVGVALLMLLPERYLAFATLEIAAVKEKIMRDPVNLNDLNMKLKTEAARFKGRDVLLKALKEDKVRNLSIIKRFPSVLGAITWLEENLKIDVQDNNQLMSVTLPGDAPEELVVLLDALKDAYLLIINGREAEQRKFKVKKLEKVADELKEKLEQRIAMRQGLSKSKGIDSAAMGMVWGMKIQQLQEARRGQYALQNEAAKSRAKLEAIKKANKAPKEEDIPDTALLGLLEKDSTLSPKLRRLGELQKALSHMRLRGTPSHDSTYQQLAREEGNLDTEVKALKRKLRKEVLERYRKKIEGDYQTAVQTMELEIEPLEKEAKKLEEQVEMLDRETQSIGFTNAKLEMLKHEIDGLEKQHGHIAEQLKTLEIEADSEPRVTANQDAVWQVKDAKRRLMILAAVPLVAGVGGVVLVGWLEFRARRIASADEVAVGLGMRVLGAVPALNEAGRRQMLAPEEGSYDHNLVESIDALRTTLLRSAREVPTKVVMVTSAVSGEGKTTVASNLAVSLARAGRRTLLIDCDLRRPALHQLFEQTLQPGFSEVLLGEVDLPDAVRPTTTDDHLWLLPAGQWDREVIQELARDNLTALLERLRDEFDFVVVDSHPVLPATDSLLLGQHADAVIVSLLRNVSQAPRVYAAYQRLATLGIRVFGAVVNGMPSEVYANGYHYQYSAESVAA
jgi:capsular exopolysaccharide synthesis family protein